MIGRKTILCALCLAAVAATPMVRAQGAEGGEGGAARGEAAGDRDALPRVEPYNPVQDLQFDRTEPMPPELQDVEVTEKLGETIDLGLTFTDSDGREVELADYFDGQTPVLLNLSYFRCPMSCPIITHNLAMTLRELELEAGEDYRVLTVSFDPSDSVAAALKKQDEALAVLGDAGSGGDALGDEASIGPDAWPFLVGSKQASEALADQVGYGFKYLPGPRQYTHLDLVIVLSPEGKVTRYLYGREQAPMTLQLSLVEAAEGKVGSTLDQVRLFCFHYTGEKYYAVAAQRLMTAGGAVTVVVLGGVLGALWMRERRKRRRDAESEADADAG